MSINSQAIEDIVAEYNSDAKPTVKMVAEKLGHDEGFVRAALKLANVKMRRGQPGGNLNALAIAHKVRSENAARRKLVEVVSVLGVASVKEMVNLIELENEAA